MDVYKIYTFHADLDLVRWTGEWEVIQQNTIGNESLLYV